MASHLYRATIDWSGPGTTSYAGYRRDHVVRAAGKAPIPLTSGIAPNSSPTHYNPEELIVGALASCHMLWYLHLCAEAGVVVTAYHDEADGELDLDRDGGRIVRVTLRPRVVIAGGEPELARALHRPAHDKCFVARSVNFPVGCEPTIVTSLGRPAGRP